MVCALGMACEVQRMQVIPGADEHHHFCTKARRGVSSQHHRVPPAWGGGSEALLLVSLSLEKGERAKRVCTHV